MLRTLAIGVVLIAAALPAVAQNSVRAFVPSSTIRAGVPFRIHVTIEGDRFESMNLPPVAGIEINERPIGQSSRIVTVNGRVTSTTEYILEAVAQSPGDYEIPPFVVKHPDGDMKSDRITITVLPPDAPAPTEATNTNPQPTGDDRLTADSWDKFTWIESATDKKRAYVGEAIQLTLTHWFITGVNVAINGVGPTEYTAPSTRGFYKVENGERQDLDSRYNYTYRKRIFDHVLYPTEPGRLTIGPWSWRGRGDIMQNTFFLRRSSERHPYSLETDPIEIEVLPLPEAPAEFSGGVGEFDTQAQLQPPSVVVGQPARLELHVRGRGNPDIIGAPVLAEIPDAFVSNPEIRMIDMGHNDPTAIHKVFVWEIVPKKASDVSIPGVTFTFFDPNKENYVAKTTDSLTLGVVSAPEGLERIVADSGMDDPETRVQLTNKNLAPIVRSPGAIYARGDNGYLFAGMIAAPILGYAGFALFLARRRYFENDTDRARSHFAHSRAKKRLHTLSNEGGHVDGIYQALRGYIADRFAVPEGGITSHDAGALLDDAGVESAVRETVLRTLRACERAAYASQSISHDEFHAMLNGAMSAIDRLEPILAKRARA